MLGDTKKHIVLLGAMLASVAVAGPIQRIHNDKVVSLDYTLKPGETAHLANRPAVTVYFDNGSVQITGKDGQTSRKQVMTGETVFGNVIAIRNTGTSDLKFDRTEFLTAGNDESWGHTGLAPNYKVLIENKYARVYDIKIPAHDREPQHTHHARVVVCLSGAELKHLMPDGREEPSTLRTGEVAWRRAATHIGQNLGDTNLWVIAIEPK